MVTLSKTAEVVVAAGSLPGAIRRVEARCKDYAEFRKVMDRTYRLIMQGPNKRVYAVSQTHVLKVHPEWATGVERRLYARLLEVVPAEHLARVFWFTKFSHLQERATRCGEAPKSFNTPWRVRLKAEGIGDVFPRNWGRLRGQWVLFDALFNTDVRERVNRARYYKLAGTLRPTDTLCWSCPPTYDARCFLEPGHHGSHLDHTTDRTWLTWREER